MRFNITSYFDTFMGSEERMGNERSLIAQTNSLIPRF